MKKFYRLYVDESGDHYYSDTDDPERRYLCLLGCIFDLEYYEKEFQPKFEEKEKAFNKELLEIFRESKYGIISVVIDKKFHHKRWGNNAAHPYHYCLLALVQRFVGFLNRYNAKSDVLAESRGTQEDLQLKSEFTHLYETGTPHVSSLVFQRCLSSRQIKLRKKYQNIAGLQVSDLLAHPCKQDVLLDYGKIDSYYGKFGKKILEIAKTKYNKWALFNKVDGYGRVFIK